MIFAPIIVLLLVGGLLVGGVYAIVLVPIAVIIAIGAVVWLMWASATRPEKIPGEREPVQPLPHTNHSNVAATPSTPSDLVDARQREQ